MASSLFAIDSAGTLLVPSGSMPSIGSLSGGGTVQMGDAAGQAKTTFLSSIPQLAGPTRSLGTSSPACRGGTRWTAGRSR